MISNLIISHLRLEKTFLQTDGKSLTIKLNLMNLYIYFFFNLVPSSEETSFWPPSMVYISINIAYIYFTDYISIMGLWGQLAYNTHPEQIQWVLREWPYLARSGIRSTVVILKGSYLNLLLMSPLSHRGWITWWI